MLKVLSKTLEVSQDVPLSFLQWLSFMEIDGWDYESNFFTHSEILPDWKVIPYQIRNRWTCQLWVHRGWLLPSISGTFEGGCWTDTAAWVLILFGSLNDGRSNGALVQQRSIGKGKHLHYFKPLVILKDMLFNEILSFTVMWRVIVLSFICNYWSLAGFKELPFS